MTSVYHGSQTQQQPDQEHQMTASHYWLAQWLDENEIHSEWEVDHTLANESGVKGFIEFVSMASENIRAGQADYPDPGVLSDPVIAGTKLDLSGRMACPSYGCMRQRIDSTFKRVWHYFDQIVVVGLPVQFVAVEMRKTGSENFSRAMMRVRDQARLLLYLREIGAERFVVFSPRSHPGCQDHWQQHARELGLAAISDESWNERAIKKFVESSKFDIVEADNDVWYVVVTGAYLPGLSKRFVLPKGEASKHRPTPEYIAHKVIAELATDMISDVGLARRLTSPLVESANLPWIPSLYRDDNGRTAEGDAAVVQVGLPVFDSLSTKDFLSLREDERPAFETFRAELRNAIQSEIAQNPSNSSAVIAKNIQNEYLRPGLAGIEQRNRNRRSALLKRQQ